MDVVDAFGYWVEQVYTFRIDSGGFGIKAMCFASVGYFHGLDCFVGTGYLVTVLQQLESI
jgi:hypothetical protein